MAKEPENLIGKFCPYPVVTIICHVGNMVQGETRNFIVDDPLATKSVPEELEDFENITCEVIEHGENWMITIKKS